MQNKLAQTSCWEENNLDVRNRQFETEKCLLLSNNTRPLRSVFSTPSLPLEVMLALITSHWKYVYEFFTHFVYKTYVNQQLHTCNCRCGCRFRLVCHLESDIGPRLT